MSIESTCLVKRSTAVSMLSELRITVYPNDCLERLADMLYEHRMSIFENYQVVEDDYICDEYEGFKHGW